MGEVRMDGGGKIIAQHMGIKPASVSRLLARARRNGLVEAFLSRGWSPVSVAASR